MDEHYTIQQPDGTKRWYKNGKLHREDGPAVITADGTLRWYLEGKIHSKTEWIKATVIGHDCLCEICQMYPNLGHECVCPICHVLGETSQASLRAQR